MGIEPSLATVIFGETSCWHVTGDGLLTEISAASRRSSTSREILSMYILFPQSLIPTNASWTLSRPMKSLRLMNSRRHSELFTGVNGEDIELAVLSAFPDLL